MADNLPQEWDALTTEEKREVIHLLKSVGIEGVRELLAGQRQTHHAKAP